MSQKKPTETLEEEHRAIRKVVGAMAVLTKALRSGHEVDAATVRSIVEFMRIFEGKNHHGKEEDLLFAALEANGVPSQGCAVRSLIDEHREGRVRVKALADAVEEYEQDAPSSSVALAKALRSLTRLYPNHIWKEDYLLFPMADKVLAPEEQEELRQKFGVVEDEIGRGTRERLVEFADTVPASVMGGTAAPVLSLLTEATREVLDQHVEQVPDRRVRPVEFSR